MVYYDSDVYLTIFSEFIGHNDNDENDDDDNDCTADCTGVWGGNSSFFPLKLLNVLGQQGWYYQQIMRLADGKSADTAMHLIPALCRYLADEWMSAARLKR